MGNEMNDSLAQQILAKLDQLSDKLDSLRSVVTSNRMNERTEYLTAKQTAAEFGVSTQMLYKLKALHTKVGRLVRFRRIDLENYIRRDRLVT
jgi:hypothetical protein